MVRYRALAICRAKERRMRKRFRELDTLAINYRLHRHNHPRASHLTCRIPLA